MGRTTDAWVVGTNESFACCRNLLVVLVKDILQKGVKIGLDLALVLRGGGDDFRERNAGLFVDCVAMEN